MGGEGGGRVHGPLGEPTSGTGGTLRPGFACVAIKKLCANPVNLVRENARFERTVGVRYRRSNIEGVLGRAYTKK